MVDIAWNTSTHAAIDPLSPDMPHSTVSVFTQQAMTVTKLLDLIEGKRASTATNHTTQHRLQVLVDRHWQREVQPRQSGQARARAVALISIARNIAWFQTSDNKPGVGMTVGIDYSFSHTWKLVSFQPGFLAISLTARYV